MNLTLNDIACSIEVDLYASGRIHLTCVQHFEHSCFIPEVLCHITIEDNAIKLAKNEMIIQEKLFSLLKTSGMVEKVIRCYKDYGLVVKITPELEEHKKLLLNKIS